VLLYITHPKGNAACTGDDSYLWTHWHGWQHTSTVKGWVGEHSKETPIPPKTASGNALPFSICTDNFSPAPHNSLSMLTQKQRIKSDQTNTATRPETLFTK
jgi:hypothetical protein